MLLSFNEIVEKRVGSKTETSNKKKTFKMVAQLNFSGPKFVFAKGWEVLKNHLAANFKKSNIGPGRLG